jgi:hypothetical protein
MIWSKPKEKIESAEFTHLSKAYNLLESDQMSLKSRMVVLEDMMLKLRAKCNATLRKQADEEPEELNTTNALFKI